jgi:hypothetical protein
MILYISKGMCCRIYRTHWISARCKKTCSDNEFCVLGVFGEIACGEKQVLAGILGRLVLTSGENVSFVLAVVFDSLFWDPYGA